MLRDNVLSDKTGIDFFYPVLNARTCNISNAQLLDAASSFEIDTSGKNGERIHFVLLHGNVQQSMYYKDDVLYAQAQFEANIPMPNFDSLFAKLALPNIPQFKDSFFVERIQTKKKKRLKNPFKFIYSYLFRK